MGIGRAKTYIRNLNARKGLEDLPSPKTGKVDIFLVHVGAEVDSMERRLEIAASETIQAICFRWFGLRQRVLGSMFHRFESDDWDVVVAFGDHSFLCRDRFPAPAKITRREPEKRVGIEMGPGAVYLVGLEFRDVNNDDYTSKLGSKSNEVLEPM